MDWKDFWNQSSQVSDVDFHRQVGRTFNQKRYSDREDEVFVARLLSFLEPSPDKTLLDLACGNGLVTASLAPHFKKVTAVDFSEPLIETATRHFARSNVNYIVGDATDLSGIDEKYDAILVSAAFQFFSPGPARSLFRECRRTLNSNGRVVLGDVADRDRIWNFYRGVRGRYRYFADQIRQRPIIGHWWSPPALIRLASEYGWATTIHYQPLDLPNHYFRYDAVLENRATLSS